MHLHSGHSATMTLSRRTNLILRVLVWLHLFTLPEIALALASSPSTAISHLSRPSGRVSLFSFERGHLRTITDTVDSEVVLTMPPRYFEAYLFECNATFPVQWAYIGEAAPVVTADVGRFFQDFYDVNTYTYQSILLMYSLQELQSGRYICRGASKEHDKLAIHYDVFVPGNGTQILLSTSEKKLFIPETKEHAYIPCGVSDSTAVINLYRGNQWGTFYPVPVNGSITFNPRKGFKIRFKDFLDPWGTYLCVSEGNKRRRKVHLIPETLKAKYDLINHVAGKIPVYFSYEYEFNRVLCCTGTNFIPKLQWAGCGSILDCQVKSACFEEDRCEQRLGNSGYNPSKWIDPGPLPSGCSGYRLRDDPNGDFGLFKCTTPGIAQYQPYLLNRGIIFLDFEKTPPSEMILTLQRISPEGPSYVGDELEFHCNSTRFEKRGGEIDFVDDAAVVRDKYSVRGHRRRTTFKIPHADIKSIICFVPVVNSATEWRTVSLPVVITPTPHSNSNDDYLQPHQNPGPAPAPPPPSSNMIDLDSLTYHHADYDGPATTNAVPDQPYPHPHSQPQAQPLKQHHSQVYQSAKAPYHQPVVPSSGEQQQHHQQPNYYSYGHDSSGEQHLPQVPSNTIEPLSQPQTVEVFQAYSQASTPAPNIIAIYRSNKKSRSRSSKPLQVPKPEVIYDTERDYNNYDTFEPKPSSNRLHHTAKIYRQHQQKTVKASPSPRQSPTSASRRPPSSTAIPSSGSYRRQNSYHEEVLYTSPRKSYRDYHNYNDKHRDHEFGVEMKLALPVEPLLPRGSRGRYAYSSAGGNYSTVGPSRDTIPLRVSSGSRSNSRRTPTPGPPPPPAPSHRHREREHSHTRHRNPIHSHSDKDYSIDESYSQHVRLALPANSVSTQLPKLSKSGRSRNRVRTQPSPPPSQSHSHSRGRGHNRNHQHHTQTVNQPRNPDYYYTDDSPVEIKVPRTKSHEPYRHSRPRQYHEQHHSQSHRNKEDQQFFREASSAEPELHETSPTTYRRRPQPQTPQPDPPAHSHSTSSSHSDSRTRHYQHGRYHHHQTPEPDQARSPSTSGRHRDRSYARGMKFGTEAESEEGLIIDAFEHASPTARPAYFLPTTPKYGIEMVPQQHPLLHNSNELINSADMELKRVQPVSPRPTSGPLVPIELRRRPSPKPGKAGNSSDLMHSVSISISSRLHHAGYEDDDVDGGKNGVVVRGGDGEIIASTPILEDHHVSDGTELEGQDSDDYDVYSPQYTNYAKTTNAPSSHHQGQASASAPVPIQFFHKPSAMSSFRPALSTLDEDDEEDELG